MSTQPGESKGHRDPNRNPAKGHVDYPNRRQKRPGRFDPVSRLSDSLSLALDLALFDANAATADRPAGLRYNIAALTAATGGGSPAMVKDLSTLAAAVSGVAGALNNLAYVMHPTQALTVALSASTQFRVPILASNGVAAGVVICICLAGAR